MVMELVGASLVRYVCEILKSDRWEVLTALNCVHIESGTSRVGEYSCNGGYACRYSNWGKLHFRLEYEPMFCSCLTLSCRFIHFAAVSPIPTSLIVADNACNDHYACSDVLGDFNASDYTCHGVYACAGTMGYTNIAYGGCNKDGACQSQSGKKLML